MTSDRHANKLAKNPGTFKPGSNRLPTEAELNSPSLVIPDWPAPSQVGAVITNRLGGQSVGPYRGLNMGLHVGDDPKSVLSNRQWLQSRLPAQIQWLHQVHGIDCIELTSATAESLTADAAWTETPGIACTVMTADCLPILLCDLQGQRVAAVHAGWRGLAAGVLESALKAFTPKDTLAWLGPAIGPLHFEVGEEVRERFCQTLPRAETAFSLSTHSNSGKPHYLADLFTLGKLTLNASGVTKIYGGGNCTYSNAGTWYSYRRHQQTGRMASIIWLNP